MFREEMEKIPMDRKALRNFGLLMAVVLFFVGGWLWWKSSANWPWLLGSAMLFGMIGVAVPMILRPLYRAWMILAEILGWVMTRVILTVVYSLVSATWYSSLVVFVGKLRRLLVRRRTQKWLKAVTGTILLGMGIKLAVQR